MSLIVDSFQNKQSSIVTFLSLPLELRLEIYAYLLHLLHPITIHPPANLTDHDVHPQILSVCRQTHIEALPLLYRHNKFLAHPSILTGFPRLRPWYPPIKSSAMVSLIVRFKLRIRLDASPGFTRELATRAFSGMEEVEIEAWQAAYRSAGHEVLGLFEDVRGVRKARVTGSVGGFEAYAAWLEGVMMKGVGEVAEIDEESRAVVEDASLVYVEG